MKLYKQYLNELNTLELVKQANTLKLQKAETLANKQISSSEIKRVKELLQQHLSNTKDINIRNHFKREMNKLRKIDNKRWKLIMKYYNKMKGK